MTGKRLFLLTLYEGLMTLAAPLLAMLLRLRAMGGKEDNTRLNERTGIASRARPSGFLVWIHAASVGEAQSTFALIEELRRRNPDIAILLTTGTVTSAKLVQSRLNDSVIHQFYPLDRPAWAQRFLDHGKPDLVLWMESELWPAMLARVQDRAIPAALINARLSPRSYTRWKSASATARFILGTFKTILAQTEDEAARFEDLTGRDILVPGNIKYAAVPLPCDNSALAALEKQTARRKVWLYASTHDGEETLAARIHTRLAPNIPGLLTIIVPRHPARGRDIAATLAKQNIAVALRSNHAPVQQNTAIYIADTLGELGLFYRLAPVACIGRSFSDDGGGGHNPIEAAQLGCAVLHGPKVQNLAQIYADMDSASASLRVNNEDDFVAHLGKLLTDNDALEALRARGLSFTGRSAAVLDSVMDALAPLLPAGRSKAA